MKQLTEEQARECHVIVEKRIISLIGKKTPDWEDLTQDIMLSMTKAIKIFRRDADIKTLLYTVTMRRYSDYLRKKYGERRKKLLQINLILSKCKLTNDQKGLLISMRKTIQDSTNGGEE